MSDDLCFPLWKATSLQFVAWMRHNLAEGGCKTLGIQDTYSIQREGQRTSWLEHISTVSKASRLRRPRQHYSKPHLPIQQEIGYWRKAGRSVLF